MSCINTKKLPEVDEYIASVIESSRYLALEEAVDDYLSAEADLLIEATTAADRYIDDVIDSEGLITGEDIDAVIDSEDEIYIDDGDNVFDDEDEELEDIHAVLDLEPEVDTLADEFIDCDYE